jgi:hypothetical protein
MPEIPLNRRRARLLRLLWDQWDRDREAHRPTAPITTGTVHATWYRTPDGLGPNTATARDDLAHLARTGHLREYRNQQDGNRYYRLDTETAERAGLWLMDLPADHPARTPAAQAAARLDPAGERLLRTAYMGAFNSAACGYPLAALDAHAERLHNQARTAADRIEADGFDLGVAAARTALADRNTELAAA